MLTRRTILGLAGGLLAAGAVLVTAKLVLPRAGEPVSAEARLRAIDELGKGPGGASRLRAAYEKTEDRAVRDRILREMAKSGGAEEAAWLASVAASDDTAMAPRAGAALGNLTDPGAAGTLEKMAASGEAPVLVRANAAKALGASGSAEQEATLAKLASDPAEPLRVRQEAALSLAEIGSPTSVPALSGALDALAGEAGSDAEQLRIALVRALAGIDGPEARATIDRHAARSLSQLEAAYVARARGTRTQ